MAPWPGQHGQHDQRGPTQQHRRARKGKGKKKLKRALAVDRAGKAVEAAGDARAVQAEPAGEPTLVTTAPATSTDPTTEPSGAPPLATNSLEASGDSNQPPLHGPEDDCVGPPSGSPDPRACRDLPELSKVPDSQPAPACLSGQTGVSPTSTPDADRVTPVAGRATPDADRAALLTGPLGPTHAPQRAGTCAPPRPMPLPPRIRAPSPRSQSCKDPGPAHPDQARRRILHAF